LRFVPHFVDGAAEKQITKKPVSVGGHCDQIALSIFGRLQNSLRRITERENSIAGKTFAAQLTLAFFKISAVLLHFLALGQLKLIEIAGYPPVGNVDEEQFSASHARQRFDVAENRLVSIAVFERDENVSIHF